MYEVPPLNALRAFEATARHLSLTRAALELHVSPGAISHQLRGLEELLGVKLFERKVRSIALTAGGKMLYPHLQRGFAHISEAMAQFNLAGSQQEVLVVSTSPGLTSKWLAPRLSRFANAHPGVDVRISSSHQNANFEIDDVHVAVRSLPIMTQPDSSLVAEKLIDVNLVPVCSPRLLKDPTPTPRTLAKMPLIHDDSLVGSAAMPTWSDWFEAAGLADLDVPRGLRFNSSDHALEAAGEGGGFLLTHDLMAYDDLKSGRLVIPFPLALPSGRAFYLVRPKREKCRKLVDAFRTWIVDEIAQVDWTCSYAKSADPQGHMCHVA
ncbi:MAG: transcriptional regulator GcvA [Xanthobacteraceae bacterium]